MERPLTILRDLERGEWEMVTAEPQLALRPHVARYTGWFEKRATPLQRREIPSQYIPLIINFASPIRVSHAADPTRSDSFGSFTTGAYDSYVLVETAAGAGGIQIDFTLLGARGFIGAPLDGLANRAVSLDEIFGTKGRELTAALFEARSWQRRFDLLDRVIASRLARGGALSSEIVWAWNRIVDSYGPTSRSIAATTTSRISTATSGCLPALRRPVSSGRCGPTGASPPKRNFRPRRVSRAAGILRP